MTWPRTPSEPGATHRNGVMLPGEVALSPLRWDVRLGTAWAGLQVAGHSRNSPRGTVMGDDLSQDDSGIILGLGTLSQALPKLLSAGKGPALPVRGGPKAAESPVLHEMLGRRSWETA